jgi:hypothetical protein
MPNFEKNWRPSRPVEASVKFAERVDELRASLRILKPEQIAARAGISYRKSELGSGEFLIPLWGNPHKLTWPELTGSDQLDRPLPDFQLALHLHHLLTADGTPLSDRWVSFADLPGGRMYNAAYQGYSGDQVVKVFGLNLDPFREACLSTGGVEASLASASFTFRPLPRVPLLVTYWLGDEDFPSSCKILFDASATHYLPIDGCAILGSMLVRMLQSAA